MALPLRLAVGAAVLEIFPTTRDTHGRTFQHGRSFCCRDVFVMKTRLELETNEWKPPPDTWLMSRAF
ncbi:hypothetical protein [Bauldia litoralis]|uniref:hypothetical protein n=1 Tax=Bauldia litoralis TaxID=665467 RepID=UPI00158792AD|nr:hypothetical protein [Bauldia litoralis]